MTTDSICHWLLAVFITACRHRAVPAGDICLQTLILCITAINKQSLTSDCVTADSVTACGQRPVAILMMFITATNKQ